MVEVRPRGEGVDEGDCGESYRGDSECPKGGDEEGETDVMGSGRDIGASANKDELDSRPIGSLVPVLMWSDREMFTLSLFPALQPCFLCPFSLCLCFGFRLLNSSNPSSP